jgi:hypothetical protein
MSALRRHSGTAIQWRLRALSRPSGCERGYGWLAGRQHAEQRERAEHEADDRLKNYEQEQCWDADTLPEKPEDAPGEFAAARYSLVHWRAETHSAHG